MKKFFIKRNEVMKYLVYFAIILLFTLAKTTNGLMPFGLPAFSALVYAKVNIVYIFPVYFVGMMLKDMSWQNVIIAVVPMFLFIMAYFIYHKLKRRMSIVAIIFITLLSEVPYIIFEWLWGNIYKCVIEVLVSLVLTYVFSVSSHAVILRGLKFRLSVDEKISSMIVIMVMSLSLHSIEIDGVNLLYPFFAFALMFSGYALGGTSALYLAVTVGVGACLSNGETELFTLLVIMGIIVVMFQNLPPYFSAVALSVSFTIGMLYIEDSTLWYVNIILVIFALLMYVVIPKKYRLKSVISNLNTSGVGKSVVNRNRREIYERLMSLSSVFSDIKDLLNVDEKVDKISDIEIAKSIAVDYCGKCENSKVCFSQLGGDTSGILENVVSSAIRHKKASIIDMPPFITSRCKRLNGLINVVNDKISTAKIYENAKINEIDNQNMLAVEMNGVADIFDNLGKEYKRPLSFDMTRERRILDELSFHGVEAKEVLLYGEKEDIYVSLIVEKSHGDKKIIRDILSVILKVKLEVVSKENFADRYVTLTLIPMPKYDVVYSVKNASRDGISGDVVTIKKFKNDKILFALSDGMGSGTQAENIAEKAVRMVESFYIAGFSSSVVGSVTNRMLLVNNNENFSAVDIVTLDLNTGACTFIKYGGVYSLIKHDGDVEVIEGHAMPLGIINGVKSYEEKRMLMSGDIVFIMSDGITDVLSITDILEEIEDKLNPETLADDLLNLAKERGASDDATVMCIKIFDT